MREILKRKSPVSPKFAGLNPQQKLEVVVSSEMRRAKKQWAHAFGFIGIFARNTLGVDIWPEDRARRDYRTASRHAALVNQVQDLRLTGSPVDFQPHYVIEQVSANHGVETIGFTVTVDYERPAGEELAQPVYHGTYAAGQSPMPEDRARFLAEAFTDLLYTRNWLETQTDNPASRKRFFSLRRNLQSKPQKELVTAA